VVGWGNVGLGWPARASLVSPAMADVGGRGRREGSRDGGVSCPIYRLEGSWARLMAPRGGRSGPGWLDGEVAEGAAAGCMVGQRGAVPEGQGRVASEGRAS